MSTVLYCDGSFIPSSGPAYAPAPARGGWGALLLRNGLVQEMGGADLNTTNNRMEILAVLTALQSIAPGEKVVVYSDSTYVVRGASQWVWKWKKEGRLVSGTSGCVKNSELWLRLLQEIDRIGGANITWSWIKGHGDCKGNIMADKIARLFAEGRDVTLRTITEEEYGGNWFHPEIERLLPKHSKAAKKERKKKKTDNRHWKKREFFYSDTPRIVVSDLTNHAHSLNSRHAQTGGVK